MAWHMAIKDRPPISTVEGGTWMIAGLCSDSVGCTTVIAPAKFKILKVSMA